jgi:hypothetical protein
VLGELPGGSAGRRRRIEERHLEAMCGARPLRSRAVVCAPVKQRGENPFPGAPFPQGYTASGVAGVDALVEGGG